MTDEKKLEMEEYGQYADLKREKWNDGKKYLVWEISGVNHKAYVKKIGFGKTMKIKVDTWKKAGGDKEVFSLLIRYELAKHRVYKVDNKEMHNSDGNPIESEWEEELDEDIVEYIVNELYGMSTMENPMDEEFLKNLIGDYLKDEELWQSISKNVNLPKKDSSLENPQTTST